MMLLWLSHLLLTPFDLNSISDKSAPLDNPAGLLLPDDIPPLAVRVLVVGLHHLPSVTKTQNAAATLLIRFVNRPDMQRLSVADFVFTYAKDVLDGKTSTSSPSVYELLGSLRFLAGVSSSADLRHLHSQVYIKCEKLTADETSPVSSNAASKQLALKVFRNLAVQSLRSAGSAQPLSDSRGPTDILEDVIDYCLGSLGDRDTPVRYASAKAISTIVLALEPQMGHEVIQAILAMFKEDMPRRGTVLDFNIADALKWHGLTLALAHTLFKRSASHEQLQDIIEALLLALQFEQRSSTGSTIGTNVRDAANFGIWSMSRRYTTNELLSVTMTASGTLLEQGSYKGSIIQTVATQLVLAACLDPAGNIRRGSSAALQELVGRHPNEVYEGIALVQIVDYQAVGLRRRGLVGVTGQASELCLSYWSAALHALTEWRGLGSPDVASRQAAALSLANLNKTNFAHEVGVLHHVMAAVQRQPDVEKLQGCVCTLGHLFDAFEADQVRQEEENSSPTPTSVDISPVLRLLETNLKGFSARVLRSDLPAAAGQLLGAYCRYAISVSHGNGGYETIPFDSIENLTSKLLTRHDEPIQEIVPGLVRALLKLKRAAGRSLGCIGAQTLRSSVAQDSRKSLLSGAGKAMALGALAPFYAPSGLMEATPLVVSAYTTLRALLDAMNVEWRIVGLKALQSGLDAYAGTSIALQILETAVDALHRGLNDYTIDERGDIGSLVRLQAISCGATVFARGWLRDHAGLALVIRQDVLRLSLEKLDRVRLAAARCDPYSEGPEPEDVAQVSSRAYFEQRLRALQDQTKEWQWHSLLEGCVSCAGASAEPLLQASRAALVTLLCQMNEQDLVVVFSTFSAVLKNQVAESSHSVPAALGLLAFLFDARIAHQIGSGTGFSWRGLLSTVQKSHHKTTDLSKLMAAVHVYRGLAQIPAIRRDVLAKLISMLRTNPYPKVRVAVAEALFVVTGEQAMKARDWTSSPLQHQDVLDSIKAIHLS